VEGGRDKTKTSTKKKKNEGAGGKRLKKKIRKGNWGTSQWKLQSEQGTQEKQRIKKKKVKRA